MYQTLKIWLKRLKLHESTISMILGALVVVVVAILAYNFFTKGETPPQPEKVSEEGYVLELVEEKEGVIIPQGLPVEHTVSPGEHLWGISERYYGNGYNWPDIASFNTLSNPGVILVDQKLTIPRVQLRVVREAEIIGTKTSLATAISGDAYSVVKGDTLWDIAVRAYQDGYRWPEIYRENSGLIKDPDIIEVGMNLTLPR